MDTMSVKTVNCSVVRMPDSVTEIKASYINQLLE